MTAKTKTNKKAPAQAKKTGRSSAASKKPKTVNDPLAICPANGAGWCPYPFSVAQLKKRLKEKARLKQLAEQASS